MSRKITQKPRRGGGGKRTFRYGKAASIANCKRAITGLERAVRNLRTSRGDRKLSSDVATDRSLVAQAKRDVLTACWRG